MHDIAFKELDRAYGDLRAELLKSLQSLGLDPRSGSAIGSRLGVNRQLAWQVSTIACQPMASIGLGVIPGAKGLRLFVDASADELGTLGGNEIQGLRQAVERLDKAIEIHAGDRPTLALLAATWDRSEMESRTEDLRRDAHRAQCALLGARVQTQIRGIIFAPSQVGRTDRVAMASYQCLLGVTRIRSGHRSRLFFVEVPTHDDGTSDMDPAMMATFLREKFRLESDLSSIEPEQVQYLVDRHRGWVVLGAGAVGQSASNTLVFTGLPKYENPRFVEDRDRVNQIAFNCQIPTETLLIDCLMDKSLAESRDFRASLSFQCFDASTGHPMQPISRDDPAFLYDLTDIETLGSELLGADPIYPGTGELVKRAAARVGTTPDRLVGVRCRAKFVISPMSVIATRVLPKAGG